MRTILFLIVSLCSLASAAPGAESRRERTLIIYYSLSGRTRNVAEKLRGMTGGEIYEIQTVKTYPGAYPGVYEEPKRELEQNDLPELRNTPPDMSEYDLILVGAPVWWYTVPTPLMRFLQEADFVGKRVASFCTYDTTLGEYHPHFAQQAKNADVREGVSFSYPHRIPDAELTERLATWLRTVRGE